MTVNWRWRIPKAKRDFVLAVREHVGEVHQVAEVAASVPHECWTAPYCAANSAVQVLLVEPLPENAKLLREVWGKRANVRIEEVAIQLAEGPVEMWRKLGKSSNGVTDITTNWDLGKPEWTSVMVRGVPFSAIDPGDIDAMLVDVEGCEHYVLQTMVSRPKLIFVEMRQPQAFHGKPTGYAPPVSVPHTRAWMQEHHYVKVGEHFLDDIYVLKR